MYNVTLRRVLVNTFNSGRAMRITYSESLSTALGIQHVMRMRHIVICGLSGSIDRPHYLINCTNFVQRLLNL